jgi:hypothetical protein
MCDNIGVDDDDDVDCSKITMTLYSLLYILLLLMCLHCVIIDVTALLLTDWMITQIRNTYQLFTKCVRQKLRSPVMCSTACCYKNTGEHT